MVILALVILNAWYIHGATKDMGDLVKALPLIPGEDAARGVVAFHAFFEKKHALLRLTLSFSQLDRVAELSKSLLEYAQSGAVADYRVTRMLLLDAIEDMSRLERLFPKSSSTKNKAP